MSFRTAAPRTAEETCTLPDEAKSRTVIRAHLGSDLGCCQSPVNEPYSYSRRVEFRSPGADDKTTLLPKSAGGGKHFSKERHLVDVVVWGWRSNEVVSSVKGAPRVCADQ